MVSKRKLCSKEYEQEIISFAEEGEFRPDGWPKATSLDPLKHHLREHEFISREAWMERFRIELRHDPDGVIRK